MLLSGYMPGLPFKNKAKYRPVCASVGLISCYRLQGVQTVLSDLLGPRSF